MKIPGGGLSTLLEALQEREFSGQAFSLTKVNQMDSAVDHESDQMLNKSLDVISESQKGIKINQTMKNVSNS